MDWQTPIRPDWVMLGTPWGNGEVAILASTDLTSAELRAESENLYTLNQLTPVMSAIRSHTITVNAGRYIVVTAPTYGQAMDNILTTWATTNPAPTPPPVVDAHQIIDGITTGTRILLITHGQARLNHILDQLLNAIPNHQPMTVSRAHGREHITYQRSGGTVRLIRASPTSPRGMTADRVVLDTHIDYSLIRPCLTTPDHPNAITTYTDHT